MLAVIHGGLTGQAEHAREEIDAMRGLAKGTIKVGTVGSIASLVLPVAVGRVLDKWPNLRVQIIEGVWDRLAEGLLTHEIDVALSTVAPDTGEICAIADCRWQDDSHVIAAADHALRRRPLTLADTVAALRIIRDVSAGWHSSARNRISANAIAVALKQLATAPHHHPAEPS